MTGAACFMCMVLAAMLAGIGDCSREVPDQEEVEKLCQPCRLDGTLVRDQLRAAVNPD